MWCSILVFVVVQAMYPLRRASPRAIWVLPIVLCVMLLGAVGCSLSAAHGAPVCVRPPSVSLPAGAAVAVIGDSFTRGTEMGGYRAAEAWPALVQQQLHERQIDITMAVGADRGSGYVKRGSKGTAFGDQIPNVVSAETRLVLIFGSLNDGSVAAGDLAPVVRHTLLTIKDVAPCANLVVIGPPWKDAEPPARILGVRDIVRDEADSAGATFIDPIADMWFAGRPELIGPDGVHPTDEGHGAMASRIAPLIAQQFAAPSE